MSKQLFFKGLQLFCSGVTVEASFFGLVGAVELFCRLSGIGGWGCFAVVRDLVNSLCPLSHHSLELLYAADTGND